MVTSTFGIRSGKDGHVPLTEPVKPISAEIMINLVSALRVEQDSQKCATCGMALARFYNITADIFSHQTMVQVGARHPW